MEITKIPVKNKDPIRRKVAAYAKVSQDSDVQLHSLDNQVAYYSKLIKANPEWEFAGIYADEGISGTGLKNRDDFLRMMEDARQGKIDLILTKSVSRFARNTVDLLQAIRELQELHVEVRFEKDGISTADDEGELMLSLHASFAQAEAESISENVKWGKLKKMQEGRIPHYPRCFGYERQGDDYVIVPEEAEVVRYIFDSYLSGMSPTQIAKALYKYSIPFHYEEELEVDGKTFAPDFTFEGWDYRPFYMDYFGMMDNARYAKRNFIKLDDYYDIGLIPGDNLIVAFDTKGIMNMAVIEGIIQNEIIPRL